MWYFEMRIAKKEDETHEVNVPLASVAVTSYALLLPSLCENTKNRYTLVDSNWRVLNGEKELVHPHTYIQRKYTNIP
jgi:hypothetical protein